MHSASTRMLDHKIAICAILHLDGQRFVFKSCRWVGRALKLFMWKCILSNCPMLSWAVTINPIKFGIHELNDNVGQGAISAIPFSEKSRWNLFITMHLYRF